MEKFNMPFLKICPVLEDLGIDRNIVSNWKSGKVRTGCIWLRIGTSGGLF
jgi:hypothetical protein